MKRILLVMVVVLGLGFVNMVTAQEAPPPAEAYLTESIAIVRAPSVVEGEDAKSGLIAQFGFHFPQVGMSSIKDTYEALMWGGHVSLVKIGKLRLGVGASFGSQWGEGSTGESMGLYWTAPVLYEMTRFKNEGFSLHFNVTPFRNKLSANGISAGVSMVLN